MMVRAAVRKGSRKRRKRGKRGRREVFLLTRRKMVIQD